jgi:hypothetical protein
MHDSRETLHDRKVKAVWRGTGRAGSGNLSTDSGVLVDTEQKDVLAGLGAALELFSSQVDCRAAMGQASLYMGTEQQ